MKQKTNKLRKLERNRKSILTKDLKRCYICGDPKSDLHEIFGAGNRKISMEQGFVIPVCRKCHTKLTLNYDFGLMIKKICQNEFEANHTREEWMQLIHKNYL